MYPSGARCASQPVCRLPAYAATTAFQSADRNHMPRILFRFRITVPKTNYNFTANRMCNHASGFSLQSLADQLEGQIKLFLALV